MWAWSTTSKKRLCFKKERLLWRKGFLTGSAERERVPWKGFTFEFIVYFGEETMSQEKTKKHQKDSKNKKYTNLVRTPNKNNPQLPRGLGKGRSKSSSWKTVLFPLVSFIYIYTFFLNPECFRELSLFHSQMRFPHKFSVINSKWHLLMGIWWKWMRQIALTYVLPCAERESAAKKLRLSGRK